MMRAIARAALCLTALAFCCARTHPQQNAAAIPSHVGTEQESLPEAPEAALLRPVFDTEPGFFGPISQGETAAATSLGQGPLSEGHGFSHAISPGQQGAALAAEAIPASPDGAPLPALPTRHDSPHTLTEIERNTQCEDHELHGAPCRVSWVRILGSSMLFLSAQHAANLSMDEDAQQHFLNADFWYDYELTLHRYRYNRWNDDDPFGVDYIGHPIMGGITNSIYEQNDPRQRALVFENTHRYWMGRLRATAYTAIYSAQWKVGPVSESSMGNIGIRTYYSPKLGRYTNETGMVDFFVTPVGGLLWNVGEDYIDKLWFRRITHNVRNPLVLFAASFMTPCKGGANLLRFRAPWYRDRDANSPTPLR